MDLSFSFLHEDRRRRESQRQGERKLMAEPPQEHPGERVRGCPVGGPEPGAALPRGPTESSELREGATGWLCPGQVQGGIPGPLRD